MPKGTNSSGVTVGPYPTRPLVADRIPREVQVPVKHPLEVTAEARWRADLVNPIRKMALKIALIFILFRFTGLHELMGTLLGFNTYVLYVLGLPSIIACLLSRGFQRAFNWRPARYWGIFTVWIGVSALFSSWRGGSFHVVATWIRTELIVLFLIGGLIMSWREVWRLMNVLVASAVILIVLGKFFGEQMASSTRRLTLEFGTMSNSNDFAALLILVLPFLIFVAVTPGRLPLLRFLALGGVLADCYLALATASRGALIALVITALYAIVRLPLRFRIASLAVGFVACGVLFFSLPSGVKERLATVFGDDEGSSAARVKEAEEAKDSRVYVLGKSITYTIAHPLFGVGPGEFADTEGNSSVKQGLHGSWHETHNAYTQISSETGIPGLIFFLAAIVSTYLTIDRTLREYRSRPPTPENGKIVAACFCLLLSLVGFCVCIFFLSLAYRFYLPALSGIAIAMRQAAAASCSEEPVRLSPAEAPWPSAKRSPAPAIPAYK